MHLQKMQKDVNIAGNPFYPNQRQNRVFFVMTYAKLPGGKNTKLATVVLLFKNLLVLLVGQNLPLIKVLTENIVHRTVIKGGIVMDSIEFYKNEASYKASMKQAKTMLEIGLISAEDYSKINTRIAQKYGVESCSIFFDNGLIYSQNDGNIPHKEV